MALVTCPECKKQVSDQAAACPGCGRPLALSGAAGAVIPVPMVEKPTNNIGCALGLGIVFLPLIFSWFTLRKGHSTTTRVVAFAYAFVSLLVLLAGVADKHNTAVTERNEASRAVQAALADAKAAAAKGEPEQQEEGQGSDAKPQIADGVYVVGTEIKPGIYRVGKYWAREDKDQALLANDISGGCPTLVIVRPTDAYLKISGGAWDATTTSVDPLSCRGGTFLVGKDKDIAPGRYRITPDGNMAYWARLDSRLEIIANDVGSGQRIVVVRDKDFAVKFSGGKIEAL